MMDSDSRTSIAIHCCYPLRLEQIYCGELDPSAEAAVSQKPTGRHFSTGVEGLAAATCMMEAYTS